MDRVCDQRGRFEENGNKNYNQTQKVGISATHYKEVLKTLPLKGHTECKRGQKKTARNTPNEPE